MVPRAFSGSNISHYITRWLIDVGRDAEGLRVIADLHGGDPDNPEAVAEFKEIRDTTAAFVGLLFEIYLRFFSNSSQKASGAPRTYLAMWKQYKRRVLLAMSSQAFAQLVCQAFLLKTKTEWLP